MPFINSVRGSFGPQSGKGRAGPNFLLITGGSITTGGGYRIHTFTSGDTRRNNGVSIPVVNKNVISIFLIKL
jgi:hypothetical protein